MSSFGVLVFFLGIPAIGIHLIRLNRQAVEVFLYMKNKHRIIWVKLGSPDRLPGYSNGTEESAFSYLMNRKYDNVEDVELSEICNNLRQGYYITIYGILAIFSTLFVVGIASS